jgi:ferredoxin
MKKLTVDRDECIGCCRCADFAPSLFSMIGGLAEVISQPSENELADANNAIENCPVEAISWVDEE